jgi:hypothetical protein
MMRSVLESISSMLAEDGRCVCSVVNIRPV